MRALILGGAGMLGHRLWQVLRARPDTYVTLRRPFATYATFNLFDASRTIAELDATNEADLDRAFDLAQPEVVYNCVGIVKQRDDARDAVQSISINALLPHRLAARCRESGARLVHVSTDCVFSGSRGRYTEQDTPDATDLYGRSKLLGEVVAPGSVTIRTSMIGRELSGRRGLVEWFRSQHGTAVRGFTRAVFSGFTTAELARILIDVGERRPDLVGLWHASAEPISKFQLLLMLNDAMGLGTRIEPDSSFECDRSLESTPFRQATGYAPPSWQAMVDELAHDTSPYDLRMNSWTSMANTSS
ncbi:MAG TPA: SDR family oxidoreductase [Gemmatimonadaceae bacterium]|nr:SDR family oxidoreductase [Gemmatimonadaceae bacterium]